MLEEKRIEDKKLEDKEVNEEGKRESKCFSTPSLCDFFFKKRKINRNKNNGKRGNGEKKRKEL